jgi:hypothetical protein
MARNNPIPPYKGIIDALRMMYKIDGAQSLYRGVLMNIFAGSIANSAFFFVYTDGKKRYNYDPNNPYSLKMIWISWRAGLVSMALTTPLWVLKTRLVLYREQTASTVL